jgi:hypothetical protein
MWRRAMQRAADAVEPEEQSLQEHRADSHRAGFLLITGFLVSSRSRPEKRGKSMRLHDGRYECAHCGAVLDIPLMNDPRVMIRAASGQPNVRVLFLDEREIHRCEIGEVVDTGAAESSV